MAGRHETWRTEPSLWRRLRPLARGMRMEQTGAEAKLWALLRRRRLDGVAFRRQHALDRYVVDFYAPAYRLAVELDGAVHEGREEQDEVRDEHLQRMGTQVLRILNRDVLESPSAVLDRIRAAIAAREPARR